MVDRTDRETRLSAAAASALMLEPGGAFAVRITDDDDVVDETIVSLERLMREQHDSMGDSLGFLASPESISIGDATFPNIGRLLVIERASD